MGSKSSASNREGIFLRDDGNVESAQTFTNKSRAADEEEDKKRPGTSDLDFFDFPQDVDDLDLLMMATRTKLMPLPPFLRLYTVTAIHSISVLIVVWAKLKMN